MSQNIISIDSLSVGYPIRKGILQRVQDRNMVLHNVSLNIPRGKTVGLVGESGCGKTTLGLAVLGLIAVQSGTVTYNGKNGPVNLTALNKRSFRPLRKELQIIFQDPFSSLNPRMRVSQILSEGLQIHFPRETSQDHRNRCVHALETVGLSSDAMDRFPHEFSGGQRQRISIARSIILEPEFIVCDESVSALDVSIQAQIINLLIDLQNRMGLSYLFISHDLSVVRHISHEIAVIENGVIVESGPALTVTDSPRHEYTKKLLSAIPTIDLSGNA